MIPIQVRQTDGVPNEEEWSPVHAKEESRQAVAAVWKFGLGVLVMDELALMSPFGLDLRERQQELRPRRRSLPTPSVPPPAFGELRGSDFPSDYVVREEWSNADF